MKFLLLALCLYGGSAIGQTIIPFLDFNDYFKYYRNGIVQQLEMQLIEEFKVSDEMVAYYDNRGNLRVYDGSQIRDLANIKTEYELSDHYLTWKIATTLNLYETGKMQTLTYNAGGHAVMDSMVVYHDLRYNNLTVYENGSKNVAYTSTGDFEMPMNIGDNTFAFKDNGDFFKIYWRGKIYDIDVWVGSINFAAGLNVVAWNDPNTRTFAVFEKGTIMDVENMYAKSFQCGRNFVVYEDQNNNLIKFSSGQKKTLSQFGANQYFVKDDLVAWQENGFFFVEQNGVKIQLANFVPEKFEMKNNTLVFRNAMGGVSALTEGKIIDLTNQLNADFQIIGNSVLVSLFNRSYIIYDKGKKFQP